MVEKASNLSYTSLLIVFITAHFCIAAIVATLKISEDEQPLDRS